MTVWIDLNVLLVGLQFSVQVAHLWQTDRATYAILRGWVNLRLNLWLKGYVLRQYLWTIRRGEWLYYNFAAGSFHTKKLCSRLYLIEIEFYLKITHKNRFWAIYGGLRDNVRTPSIVRWEAVVDFAFVTIELFSLSRTVETLWAEICRSWRFLKGVDHFERNFSTDRRTNRRTDRITTSKTALT